MNRLGGMFYSGGEGRERGYIGDRMRGEGEMRR